MWPTFEQMKLTNLYDDARSLLLIGKHRRDLLGNFVQCQVNYDLEICTYELLGRANLSSNINHTELDYDYLT